MRFVIFTPAERRLAVLLFLLTLLGLLARGGRSLSPEVAAWLDETADRRSAPAGDSASAPTADRLPPPAPPAAPGPPSDLAPRVDPNQAGLDELTALPGVGPVLARRILEDRNRNGAYRTVEDLRRVSGIGKTTLARMRGYLVLKPPPRSLADSSRSPSAGSP